MLDKARLEAALAAERKRKLESSAEEDPQGPGGWSMPGGKKGKYNNARDAKGGEEVTEEELEAYRMAKSREGDDPMAGRDLGEDELLPL